MSRRLALVEELPGEVQQHVLLGRLPAHTAMKVLVPLARANLKDCLRLCTALLKARFTTREAVALKAGWQQGTAEARERLLADPVLFLRSLRALAGPEGTGNPFHLWLEDMGTLAAVARRAKLYLRQASSDCQALFQRSERELPHA